VFDRCDELDERGFVVVPNLLSADECDALAAALPASESRRGGVRDLLGVAAVRGFLSSSIVREIVGDSTPMSATLFDKTPAALDRVVAPGPDA